MNKPVKEFIVAEHIGTLAQFTLPDRKYMLRDALTFTQAMTDGRKIGQSRQQATPTIMCLWDCRRTAMSSMQRCALWLTCWSRLRIRFLVGKFSCNHEITKSWHKEAWSALRYVTWHINVLDKSRQLETLLYTFHIFLISTYYFSYLIFWWEVQ